MAAIESLTVAVPGGQRVSALLLHPADARACYVLAHGAGAGMAHPFMTAAADGLAALLDALAGWIDSILGAGA